MYFHRATLLIVPSIIVMLLLFSSCNKEENSPNNKSKETSHLSLHLQFDSFSNDFVSIRVVTDGSGTIYVNRVPVSKGQVHNLRKMSISDGAEKHISYEGKYMRVEYTLSSMYLGGPVSIKAKMFRDGVLINQVIRHQSSRRFSDDNRGEFEIRNK